MFNIIAGLAFPELIAALIPLLGALSLHRAATRSVHGGMSDLIVGSQRVVQVRLDKIVSLMPRHPLPKVSVRLEYLALASALISVLFMIDTFIDIFPNLTKELVFDFLGLDKPAGLFVFMMFVIYVLLWLYGTRFADYASRTETAYGLEEADILASSTGSISFEERVGIRAARANRVMLREIVDELPKDKAARRALLDQHSSDDGLAG